MAKNNDDFSFAITESIATLGSPNAKGWQTEFNKVSWGGREAVYDIRSWNPEHTSCGKGKTFTEDELMDLRDALNGLTLESDL
jgi:hypothetical protein